MRNMAEMDIKETRTIVDLMKPNPKPDPNPKIMTHGLA